MTEMEFVSSSNVEAIGYDADNMELHVRFLGSPTLYVYSSVPLEIYEELRAAVSIGSYLNRVVKGNYPFEKR
ncbi:MAG: KTSC domain-containing protein [Armatimonadia bacterium]